MKTSGALQTVHDYGLGNYTPAQLGVLLPGGDWRQTLSALSSSFEQAPPDAAAALGPIQAGIETENENVSGQGPGGVVDVDGITADIATLVSLCEPTGFNPLAP